MKGRKDLIQNLARRRIVTEAANGRKNTTLRRLAEKLRLGADGYPAPVTPIGPGWPGCRPQPEWR